jgi:hypothetical protein
MTPAGPLPSWSELTWINSAQRPHFGQYPRHEPWRSPILLAPPQFPKPKAKVKKENQDRRQRPLQKRSPSHFFSSPSMSKPSAPVDMPRRRSGPILPSRPSARSPAVGLEPRLYISPHYNYVHSPQSLSPSSSLSLSPVMSPKVSPVLSTLPTKAFREPILGSSPSLSTPFSKEERSS